jgi:ribosomal protein S18 acetylase RimI-like enzyme
VDCVLRPARPDERDFFYALRRDGFRSYAEQAFGPWDDVTMRALADEEFDELPVEIIERAGEPIGYQIIVREADHWFLDEIVLIAGERGRGLGTELVTAVMTAARGHDLPLRLSVLDTNPAQSLYARLGFRVTRVEHPRIKMEWP